MMSRARLLATVLLVAPVGLACGKKDERPAVASQPASSTPSVAATGDPAVASSPAATAAAAAPAASSSPAPAASRLPVTLATQATQPEAPPPPATATSAPPATTPAEKPVGAQPAAPARPAAPRPKGKITLPAKLGAVTFDHEKHAGKLGIACATCHHPSRPEKALASDNQACRDCHTTPEAPPMKTRLQAAFHDPKGATGTCIDCHKKKGGTAPVKCPECHKKK